MMLLVLASVISVGLCAGGWSTKDPNDPEYVKEFELLISSGKVKLLKSDVALLSVKAQVVSGMNYGFVFTLGSGDNARVCELVYYSQSWTNTFRVHTDNCSVASHNKRQFVGMVDGYSSVDDFTDPIYLRMLQSLMNSKNQLSLPDGYKTVKIEKQTVATGINYKYTIDVDGVLCQVIVLHRGEYYNELSQNTCVNPSRRHFGLDGGWSPVTDMADSEFRTCVAATLDRINDMSNDMFRVVETDFLSAEQQVVAGMKYRFTVQVGESSCMNSGETRGFTASRCPLNANSVLQQTTWDAVCVNVVWEHKTEVLSLKMHH